MKKLGKHIKKLICVLAAAAVVLSMYGCDKLASVFSGNNTITDSDTAPENNNPSPIITPLPTEAPPDETINPVQAFFSEYNAFTHDKIAKLEKALTSSGKAEEQLVKAMLNRMGVTLQTVNVSIGRLTYDSTGVFNGTVVGAAIGSGTLTQNSYGVYVMRFSYDNGNALYGEYNGESLIYITGDIESGFTCCAIRKTGKGYRAAINIIGDGAILEADDEKVCFSELSFEAPVIEYDASQSDAPDLSKYDPSYLNFDFTSSLVEDYWQLDDEGLKHIVKPNVTPTDLT